MDTKGLIVDFLGLAMGVLAFMKLWVIDGVSLLSKAGDYFNLSQLHYIDNNFGYVFIVSIGIIFLMYRGKWVFALLKKILTLGKAG